MECVDTWYEGMALFFGFSLMVIFAFGLFFGAINLAIYGWSSFLNKP